MTICKTLALQASLILISACSSFAGTYNFTPTPADLNDLDHQSAYTWDVESVQKNGNFSLSTQTIVSATLTINQIDNWDDKSNYLFIHLLDSAGACKANSCVSSYKDDLSDSVFFDNFTLPAKDANPLVSQAILANGNTYLDTYTDKSKGNTPETYTYTFSAAQLLALNTYISNGDNFALGFDPDCHYYNSGIELTIMTGPKTAVTPEPANLTLLGAGLVAGAGLLRRRKK